MITLDIISDPICPWCYIGKANLDRAIAETGLQPFDIRWRIFQLNPDMPPEGMDRRDYLETKFGGPERAKAIYDRIGAAAAEAGIEANLEQIPRTPNTMDAHRVILWARSSGVQGVLVDRLFRDYFVEGRDISDHTVLIEAADAVGMDAAIVAKLLETESDRDELVREDQAAREMGVGGVPCFIVAGQHVLQGAQPAETWARVIRELATALEQQEAVP